MRSKWFFFFLQKITFFTYFFLCCMFLLERDRILKKLYVTVSATQFPTKWCPFQPPRSKTVGDTFLVAKNELFQEGKKTHQNITKCNYVPNINVNNNINCWYVVLILLHWRNNNNKKKWCSAKKIPLPPVKKILNIHHRKKNLNKSYWKFDFSMGTVFVIFSFHFYEWITPPACSLTPPIGKNW